MPSRSWRDQVDITRQAICDGRGVNPEDVLQWTAAWLGWVKPRGQETEELRLIDEAGQGLQPEVLAPRWLCHLLGLRHACSHVVLRWDSPNLGAVLVCQVRSWDKADFPGHVDVSVGGHVVGATGTAATAEIEMWQELGLRCTDLVEENLGHVGGYACDITDPQRHFYDAEWRDVYVGRLKTIEALRFVDGEVTAVTLCPVSQARQLLSQKALPVANGLKGSLPLCLDYWERGDAQ